MNKRATFFKAADFTRDGRICFGKYKDQYVWALPEEYYQHLVAHYKFNLAVLNANREK
jgi:uncharacterized protein (DUF3820 family)